MASATELNLPAVPLDVLEFARERDITSGLRPLLAITRTVFPTAAIELRVEDDPEVPDDKHTVVEVDVTGWTVDERFAAHNQWTQLFFEVVRLSICTSFGCA
jgi:hypothetical protein